MKQLSFFLLMIMTVNSFAQLTRFEESNGKQTATYFEAIEWYKVLDKSSSNVFVKEMGQTDAGYPLHLVMLSSDAAFNPQQWHQQNKVVILINNGIHPGEPDGIDASMMLVRDIINKKVTLPSNIALAFIPVYNIGGCLNRNAYTRANQNGPAEYGFRGNSQNLDLNRDFTKSDSKEARSFAAIFHYLSPDILIDNHVSDGADYQHTMTLITTQYNKLGSTLGKWVKEIFEPKLYSNMAGKGWEMIPYVDFGATDFSKGMTMFMDPPRYSSGYAALFNTISFMPETHMLKPYKERVRSTYDLMKTFIEEGSRNADELKAYRTASILEWVATNEYPLKWKADKTIFTEIVFKGFEADSAKSEATGLSKLFYNHNKPFTKDIKFFHGFAGDAFIKKPKAYIIPAGWWSVIDLLKINNVQMQQIKNDTMIHITSYLISDYKSFATPYEKHHKNYAVKTATSQKTNKFLKGDYIIYLDQPANRYIVEMLEPTGDDSYFAWNFFDGILQQKEGYSDYRWEDLAAEVLQKDPELREKLVTKKANDPKFATNSTAILDYIYKNSPYYEKAHNQYPVYRIEY
ncbi:MAG: M14 family metallopeptidase [Rhizobacter sp.]|nr:M14 family metallopeptidase [Ferruginibacter sp.]